MGLVLRVQVLKARNLTPKDKSGTSDPYLVLNLGDAKEATSVVTKTLHPEWNQTFEFPILTADSALLEVICWDKDRFKKDYMGEFDVVLEELFPSAVGTPGGVTMPEPRWFKLEGRRSGRKKKKKNDDVSGEVLLKFTLFDPTNTSATPQQLMQKFSGVVASGTDDDTEDEDLLSRLSSRDLDDVDEEDDEDEDEDKDPSSETDDGTRTPLTTPGDENGKARRKRAKKIAKLRRKSKLKAYEFSGMSDVAGVLFLELNRITDLPPEKNSTRTTFDMDPFIVTSLGKKTYRTRVVNHNLNPVFDEKLVFQVQKHEVNYYVNFAVVDRDKFSGNDFVGTCAFPLEKIMKLSPEADEATGLYKLPDPDHLGEGDTGRRKRWRLPMSRSTSQTNLSRNSSSGNLNRLSRTTSSDSLKGKTLGSGGGLSGTGHLPTRPGLKRLESESDVLEQLTHTQHMRPQVTSAPSYNTALPTQDYNHQKENGGSLEDRDPDMRSYEIPLELKKKERWQDKHNPVLYLKAKYLPYRALRQQFWRAMLKQYDADESGKIEKVELITMLDTLGSTLHNSTIDGFFLRWREENIKSGIIDRNVKDGGGKIITMDQAVICLEEQLMMRSETQSHMHRPHWHKHASEKSAPGYLTPGGAWTESSPDESPGGTTPYLGGVDAANGNDSLKPNFSMGLPAVEVSDLSEPGELDPRPPRGADSAPTTPGPAITLSPQISRQDSWGQESEADLNDDPSESREEHVVEIAECPICHMPRLNRGRRSKGKNRGRTDADIITHIATCASSDWRSVNNLVMAGFVTSSQAQRKWYSKVVSKISYGGYRLGANSANILVQDRITGMINEERMSVYVRSATSHLTIPFHLTDYVAVGRFDSASDCSTRA
jgi:phosphatidylserine decarboxylase